MKGNVKLPTINKGELLVFDYTNWKGETGKRKAFVVDFIYGANEYHPEEQFLLVGFDTDKLAYRTFALKDMTNVRIYQLIPME